MSGMLVADQVLRKLPEVVTHFIRMAEVGKAPIENNLLIQV
jgi:hypothetical protein